MGPEAAVNAVHANHIEALPADEERATFVQTKREEYLEDVDLLRLASELVTDAIVAPQQLRDELIARIAYAGGKDRLFGERVHWVPPV